MLTLLYVLIVIIAFVLAVTTSNTINSEASVIGTLRASGYTKGELLRHYMVFTFSCYCNRFLYWKYIRLYSF